jgi:outer membrane lipoprotein-sorting protein
MGTENTSASNTIMTSRSGRKVLIGSFGEAFGAAASRTFLPLLLLSFLITASFLLSGCATLPPKPSEGPSPIRSAKHAANILHKKYDGLISLRASGRITVKGPDESRGRQASMALLFQRPDKVRMRAYRTFAPLLFEFVSDGDKCWLYTPSDKTAYLNEGCAPLPAGSNGANISAEVLLAAFQVLRPFDAMPYFSSKLFPEKDSVRLEVRQDGMAWRRLRVKIWIDPRSGLALRQVIMGPGGSIQADIRYLDHGSQGGITVPVEVDIILPQVETTISIRMTKIKVNLAPPESAFDFTPPAGVRILQANDGSPLSSFQ